MLYAAGYGRSQVNAVANFCFLTQDTNLAIGKRKPEDYFSAVEAKNPGALASQWIPQDPELWRIDRYPDFLAARRELLAEAANAFLDQLRRGGAPGDGQPLERLVMVEEAEDSDSRAAQVTALIAELVELGCADPAVDCEVSRPGDGRGAGYRRGVLAGRPAARPGQSGHPRARPGGSGPAAARGDRVRGLHIHRVAARLCPPPESGSRRPGGRVAACRRSRGRPGRGDVPAVDQTAETRPLSSGP